MEKHVSTHRQCVEDLMDCAQHVTTTVPGEEQRVQYLIESIDCAKHTIQATIGLIRNNVGDMRTNFEKSASALIEVDPYIKNRNSVPKERSAQIFALDYKAGRGDGGVDLRWHTHPSTVY